ncbi:MAG: hypothetical protein GKR89_20310 [Candidatus Latescibacteria bacterium]|nr:hypothetical protein [Candidatus Latescibacterota bacterium]
MRIKSTFALFILSALLATIGANPAFAHENDSTKVDLNTASKKKLQKVLGLDAHKATLIIAEREEDGYFDSVDDLAYVMDGDVFVFDAESIGELEKYVTAQKLEKNLLDKWGKKHLKKPKVREELKLHARRMARLHRLKDIAEAEEAEKAQARIEKLIKKEQARHEKKMEKLKNR